MASRKTATQPNTGKTSDPYRDGPWNEIVGLILFGIGLVIMLALVSYSASDPSWNTTGTNPSARNWIGPVGAQLADILFQMFGLAALFVPITLFLAGWTQWQDEPTDVPKPRALGILLMIVAITGMLTMIGSDNPKSFYLGGFVGRWLVYGPGIGLSKLLGSIGAIVALLLLFIVGLLIGTEFSIVATIIKLTPTDQEAGLLGSIGDKYRNWKQERDTIRGQKETADQLREKMRSRNSPGRPVRPVVGQRGGGDGRGAEPALAGSSDRLGLQAGTEIALPEYDNLPEISSGDYEDVVEESVQPTAKLEPPAFTRTAAKGENGKTSNGATTRNLKRAKGKPDLGDSYTDGDLPLPDFTVADLNDDPNLEPDKIRTVEEMMSTASVKRPDNLEEKPSKTGKPARAATAIARIAADYKLPSTEMLSPPSPRSEMEEAELLERARQLAEKCAEFNVSGMVKQISPGPVVTTFEFKPDPGVKYSRVTSLVDDLCLALKAESIRIDRIPGKSTVGIEVPNTNREVIRLREVIESKRFRESESRLTLALGKTIDGSNYAADLARMPHLLIAGATGAGKSVMLNGILVSLLYKSSPDEVKMILVDPKRLELGLYADIPHLLTPIVTDPKRASYALKWAVSEMESRYKHLAAFGVRNIDQYNNEVCSNNKRKRVEQGDDAPKPLPYIVVVIDELADLMMVSARDVEESITRLAQMARAVGIHLVLATQRPSVDVITGLIKANFPSRISFRVSSKVDSRTIIDTNGAEQLLGQGDMLFLPPGTSRLVRVHGAYVDEKEVKRICDFVKSQGSPAYDEKVVMSEKEAEGGSEGDLPRDEKYDEALRIVIQNQKASTSLLQRTLRIGYGRAASIIDMMYREGIVGAEDGSKPRQVLVKPDFLERLDQMNE